MGIPLYFKIISEKYPNIIKDNLDNNKNNLFLDLNCAIHPCCRKILEEYFDNFIVFFQFFLALKKTLCFLS